MKEKVYAIKTKGDSKDKLYQYSLRYIFGANVENLTELIGPEASVRLLYFFGGTCMYIPSIKTTRRRLREAIVKERCIKLLGEGKRRKEIIDQLQREKVGYSRNTLKMKMTRWFGESEDKKMTMLKDICNECLLELVRENYDLFRAYRIL